MRVEGKVALVTGGARGMGEATVRRLVAEGAKVVISDILDTEGKALAEELGDAAVFVQLDVGDEAGWQETVAFTERELGRLDILVNNAGILLFGAVHKMPLEDYERLVRVNQTGVFLGMKIAVPALRRAGGGAIVNVSSVEGLGGGPMLTGYSATKFAVRGMTKAAAIELGRHNIRVNSVHPGAIRTPMVMQSTGGNEAAEAFIAKKTALGRMGEPDEVAAVIVFLASDDASYVTGAEIVIDGGVTASSGFTE